MHALPTSLFLATLFLAQTVQAATPQFALPIRCTPGQDCFIQNYYDHDPGPGWKDYACGHLSYDGHTGTDFRLPGIKAMQQGIAVLAAADGVVAGLRDGMPDIPELTRPGEPETGKHAAGNGVRIDHGGGWETQYSHMRKGSVAVHPGQKVRTGDVLGLVGLSGNTEFPHVDFTVRHNGKSLDPFSPSDTVTECAAGKETLWTHEALRSLRYIPTGLLMTGWSAEVPDWNKAENDDEPQPVISSSALVFWVQVFGIQKNDLQRFELFDPSGNLMLKSDTAISVDKAFWSAFAGKRRTSKAWQTGKYLAHYRLERYGVTVIDITKQMEMN